MENVLSKKTLSCRWRIRSDLCECMCPLCGFKDFQEDWQIISSSHNCKCQSLLHVYSERLV